MKFEKFEQQPVANNQADKKEKQPDTEEELLKYEPGIGIRFTELLKKKGAEITRENYLADLRKEFLD